MITKEEISKGYDVTTHKNGKCRLNMGKDTHTRCLNIYKPNFDRFVLSSHSFYKGKIIDIGCGGGHLLELLSKRIDTTATLYGLDISEKLCEMTRERVPTAIVTRGGVEALPYESNMFDTVFMIASLEHVFDYNKALSEVSRVLKQGGVYIVLVPNRDWLQYDFYDAIRIRKAFQPVDDHYFRYNEMKKLLENNNFVIERYRGSDNLFYYGWKHKIEQFVAFFLPFLYKKMKQHIFMGISVK